LMPEFALSKTYARVDRANAVGANPRPEYGLDSYRTGIPRLGKMEKLIMPDVLDHTAGQADPPFVDRRQEGVGRRDGIERRQFVDSHRMSRPEVAELAEAVDRYKLLHRRRFVTFEELFDVMVSLGYHK
jgi:hypothetical protein